MPTNRSLVKRLRAAVNRHLAPRRHSVLLAAIIVAFAVRPLVGDTGAGSAIFGVALVLLLLLALYNINIDEMVGERGRLLAQSRRRLIFGWTLATAAAVELTLLHNFVWHLHYTWRDRTGRDHRSACGRLSWHARLHDLQGVVLSVCTDFAA